MSCIQVENSTSKQFRQCFNCLALDHKTVQDKNSAGMKGKNSPGMKGKNSVGMKGKKKVQCRRRDWQNTKFAQKAKKAKGAQNVQTTV